jgi:hypothetical protein
MTAVGLDLLALSFGIFNALRIASYGPQVLAVARDRHGAQAISFSCWSIWVGANATTALYAWINLRDVPLTMISCINGAGCAAVLLLAIAKRISVRRQAIATI